MGAQQGVQEAHPRIGSISVIPFSRADYRDPGQFLRDCEGIMTAERWAQDSVMLMGPPRFLSAEGGALAPLIWWDQRKVAFFTEHQRAPNWGEFKQMFTEHFGPQVRSLEREARAQLHRGTHNWRAGDTVSSYVTRFHTTIMHAQHTMAEADKIEWFLSGLSPALRRDCVVDHLGRSLPAS